MAKQVIAAEDIGLTANRDKAVPFLSVEAAFLLARKGRPIAPEYENLVTRAGALKEAEPEANKEEKPVATKEAKPAGKKARKKKGK